MACIVSQSAAVVCPVCSQTNGTVGLAWLVHKQVTGAAELIELLNQALPAEAAAA